MLAIDHPNYLEAVELLPATVAELRADLADDSIWGGSPW